MKKLLSLLLAAVLVTGCAPQPGSASADSQSPAPPTSASSPAKPPITDIQRERYDWALTALNDKGSLLVNWRGTPISNDFNYVTGWEIVETAPGDDGLMVVTAELYGNLYLDPATMLETIYGTEIPILTEGLPYSPQLAVGRAAVELRDNPDRMPEPVSCRYEPYPSPGITYLKEHSASNPPPADSPKLDVSKYDTAFVNFIWHKLMQVRYIESPADITLADLAGMTSLELNYEAVPPEANAETYLTDAALLRLMPNLTYISCYLELADYSVFEGMNSLEVLSLSDMNDERMATLKVGHTDKLHLENPDCDVLRLTNVNTDTLSMTSWHTAVRGFADCDQIKNLYINSTRTDMRLVNAESFPSAEYLNLQFSGDVERTRDLSQLATFPATVPIDLMLGYMACNDKTVATLAGVPLRLLVLSPNNGAGSRVIDPELIKAVPCQKLHQGEYNGMFDQYSKDNF